MNQVKREEGTRSLISARALVKIYGKGDASVHALRGIDLDIPAGQFAAIMGPSGSGKSTLMHMLAGLDRITSGHVFFNGKDLGAMSDRERTLLRRKDIGFVFQSFNLLPMFDAEANIVMPLMLADSKTDTDWLSRLTEFLGLGQRLRHRPSELSGGQQQRVAIARALITKPKVVFADEPTGNLDSASGREVLKLLREMANRWGVTVIMVTHDPTTAEVADRVLILEDGQICEDLVRPDRQTLGAMMTRSRSVGATSANGGMNLDGLMEERGRTR